jgi:hypothetical protein
VGTGGHRWHGYAPAPGAAAAVAPRMRTPTPAQPASRGQRPQPHTPPVERLDRGQQQPQREEHLPAAERSHDLGGASVQGRLPAAGGPPIALSNWLADPFLVASPDDSSAHPVEHRVGHQLPSASLAFLLSTREIPAAPTPPGAVASAAHPRTEGARANVPSAACTAWKEHLSPASPGHPAPRESTTSRWKRARRE